MCHHIPQAEGPEHPSHSFAYIQIFVARSLCHPWESARYFMTLFDDYTRFVRVYVLQRKNNALDIFWDFQSMMENNWAYQSAPFGAIMEVNLTPLNFIHIAGNKVLTQIHSAI